MCYWLHLGDPLCVMTPYGVLGSGHYLFKYWLVDLLDTWSFVNWCWHIDPPGVKFSAAWIKNTLISNHENVFENVVCEKSVVLFWIKSVHLYFSKDTYETLVMSSSMNTTVAWGTTALRCVSVHEGFPRDNLLYSWLLNDKLITTSTKHATKADMLTIKVSNFRLWCYGVFSDQYFLHTWPVQ